MMSKKVSPGAPWVTIANLERGLGTAAAAGALAWPAAAGGWVASAGRPPALHAIAATPKPAAIATHRARLPDVTSAVPIMSLLLVYVCLLGRHLGDRRATSAAS